MKLTYSKEIYTKAVLLKTCYKFTDVAYIHLDSDEEKYMVTIDAKDESDCTDYKKEFANRIIEEANRELIFEQTQSIRKILFARSMASTVVYDSETVAIDTDIEDKSAMKDWFKDE